MRTLTVSSQKGGSGKTTLTVHLGAAAVLAGIRTAIIDLDPQGNARKWGERRSADPEVVGDHAEQLARLKEAAEANGCELLIIDTAPNADRASLLAAKASDFILIPCRPSQFDLEAIEATLDVAALAKKPAAVVINAAPHGRNGLPDPTVRDAIRWLSEKNAPVAPQVIEHRADFSHSVNDGRTALELEPKGKAAKELRSLFLWACQQANVPAGLQAGATAGRQR
jgi:chromosome partitioning protein